MNKDVCKWEYIDNEMDIWRSGCDNTYIAEVYLNEAGFNFCPGCGKPIEEVKEDE